MTFHPIKDGDAIIVFVMSTLMSFIATTMLADRYQNDWGRYIRSPYTRAGISVSIASVAALVYYKRKQPAEHFRWY